MTQPDTPSSDHVPRPEPDETRWLRRPVRAVVVQNLRLLVTAAALTVGVARNRLEDWLAGEPVELSFLTVVLAVVMGIAVLGLIGNVLAWSRFRYCVDDGGLHTRSGVLSTTTATYAPGRIDGVDINEPILQRLAGLVTLRVEVAGGSESSAQIAYLPRAEAERVQRGLLALRGRAGAERSDQDQALAVPADQAQPQELLLALGTDRARQYLLRSPGLWLSAIFALGALTGALVATSMNGFAASVQWLVLAAGWCVGTVRMAYSRWRDVATWRIEEGPEDLVISRGRLDRKRTTVRAGKVSAVVLRQGPVRRRSDWWQVEVSVSAMGSSGGEGSSAQISAVATGAEVAVLLPRLLPGLPESTAAELAAAMEHAVPAPHWIGADRFGRWWSPLSWRYAGLLMHPDHVLTRTGRWHRTIQVIARRRIQGVQVMSGPFDRAASVASLVIHLPSGPAAVTALPYLPAAQAASLMDDLALDSTRTPELPAATASR